MAHFDLLPFVEGLYIAFIASLGLIVYYSLNLELPGPLKYSLAIILGAILWCTILMLSGLVAYTTSISIEILILLMLLFMSSVFVLQIRKRPLNVMPILSFFLFLGLLVSSSWLLMSFGFKAYLTLDSQIMREMGIFWLNPDAGYQPGGLPTLGLVTDSVPLEKFLGSFGFLLPSILAPASYLQSALELFPLFFTLSFVSSAVLITMTIQKNGLGLNKTTYAITILAVLAVIFSNLFFSLNAVYLHTNILTAGFLLLGSLSAVAFHHMRQFSWLALTSISVFGLSMTRLENPVLAFFFLLVVFISIQIPSQYKKRIFFPCFLAMLVWYLFIFWDLKHAGDTEFDVLTWQTALGICLLMVLGAVGAHFWDAISATLLKSATRVAAVGIFALTILLITSPENSTIAGLFHSAMNAFSHIGLWGFSWFFIVFFRATLGPDITFEEKFYRNVILISLLMIVISSGFRIPYRLGWSDSSNRMLLHVFPLIIFYLHQKVFVILAQKANSAGVAKW